MSEFSLILSPNTSKTKISICELCKDGKSLFQVFVDEIEEGSNFCNDLAGAIRNLELAADLVRLPKGKFRIIVGITSLSCKLYEAKCGSVRIYHFEEKSTGRIIVIGGFKTQQDKDINRVIKIIKQYQNECKK